MNTKTGVDKARKKNGIPSVEEHYTKTDVKHTPTPWKVDGATKIIAPKMGVVKFGGKGQYKRNYIVVQCDLYTDPQRAVTEANAEFIVRACNSHEDLLEAAKLALRNIEYDAIRNDGVYNRGGWVNEIKALRAAIAKTNA